MAAMLCYLESVDADTPPSTTPTHHTPDTDRSCALRSDFVVCSTSSFVTPTTHLARAAASPSESHM